MEPYRHADVVSSLQEHTSGVTSAQAESCLWLLWCAIAGHLLGSLPERCAGGPPRLVQEEHARMRCCRRHLDAGVPVRRVSVQLIYMRSSLLALHAARA